MRPKRHIEIDLGLAPHGGAMAPFVTTTTTTSGGTARCALESRRRTFM